MDYWKILETIRNEIQAEHALLSHRMNWYATSQSFLMTAYAIAWTDNHSRAWKDFFRGGIPLLGGLLSICALLAIAAAVWVQWNDIKDQSVLIGKFREALAKDPQKEEELRMLAEYEKTTCSGRKGDSLLHWIAMVPPCIVPVIFIITWIVAWLVS